MNSQEKNIIEGLLKQHNGVDIISNSKVYKYLVEHWVSQACVILEIAIRLLW